MMAASTKQTKRGSRIRTTRQPLGPVSANTPPKEQQKPSNATLEPTFLPPKYISNATADDNEKQNDDDDEPSIGSVSSTSSRFSYRGIKRILSVRKSKSVKGASAVNDLLLTEKASRDDAFANEEIVIQIEQPAFVPPLYIYTPPKKELSNKVCTPEYSFIPFKYVSATTSANKDNLKHEDDEPSIGSISSMSSTASQFSYCGIKRTVSIKIKKKRGLVPKFLKRKPRSKKKQGTSTAVNDPVLQEKNAVPVRGDAFVQKELDVRSKQPTFVPPKENELLREVSTVSSKYIATNAPIAGQKQEDDKPSMMTPIALISYHGIRYTLSIKDLVDCHYNYLVGKQVVRTEQRTSRTIYWKRMPRVLRLRLKRCALNGDATPYKVLKLCQRIILQRLIVHNKKRHKSIRSNNTNMITNPISIFPAKSLLLTSSTESSLVVHPSVNDSILQDYMLYPVPNYSDYSFSSSPLLKSTSVNIHTLEIEHGLETSKLKPMMDCQDIYMDDVELGASTRYMVMDDVDTSSLIHCFAPLTHHNVSGRLTVVIAMALGVTVICMNIIRILNH